VKVFSLYKAIIQKKTYRKNGWTECCVSECLWVMLGGRGGPVEKGGKIEPLRYSVHNQKPFALIPTDPRIPDWYRHIQGIQDDTL
jgi:hypothetical protein